MTPSHALPPITAIISSGVFAVLSSCTPMDSFSQADANRDGSASCDEFCVYMKHDVFARVDTDHNDKITQAEWQQVNSTRGGNFRKSDSNGDGMITRQEADTAFERERSLERLFRRIDQDGSGGLSREEVAAFKANTRQQPASVKEPTSTRS